ncbi:hypothetical protein [Streptomyces sp. NBC_01373]|uniref:hypothetical protein n=1 Tax=Streptomyces sp. NBC_01373 TaxID=2903843 RepID=UPI00225ACBFE|nr:hypothetical protein [Streptomyces sp. NBC_01373]MCX4700063.1 hypothetical protein [Streptomyces sp. NBC_01373]
MTSCVSSGVLTGALTGVLTGPAVKRRGSPLLAAAEGRQGHLSRPAARRGRGFPGPASSTNPTNPHCIPVPAPAHHIPRAIRVRRSPR